MDDMWDGVVSHIHSTENQNLPNIGQQQTALSGELKLKLLIEIHNIISVYYWYWCVHIPI